MLNSKQQGAVNYIDSQLLVLAGAGSGKTRVITEKIAYLIEILKLKPSSIFAVTFTNKAAREMKSRIALRLSSSQRRGLKISTFHTLGLRILKKSSYKSFTILDREDSLQILSGIIQNKESSYLQLILTIILSWKNQLLTPCNVIANNQLEIEALGFYKNYETSLQAFKAYDFEDLILKPVMLLKNNSEIRSFWQQKINYLLVDEYQDSNTGQYELIKLLAQKGLTVVGDDDQSIYAWRGAKPENLLKLSDDYGDLKIIKLEQNYRSTNRILDTANKLIANNKHIFDKKLWSDIGLGEIIRVISCKDELFEAERVVNDILSHNLIRKANYNEYAILYRSNHQARIFEKVLRQNSIPYFITGGQSFFSKKEIKDIFAYVKLLVNQDDDTAFIRAISNPPRGIGDKSLTVLSNYAQQRNLSLYQCCDHLALRQLISQRSYKVLAEFKAWLEELKAYDELKLALANLTYSYEQWLFETSSSMQKAQRLVDNIMELKDWLLKIYDKEQDLLSTINKLVLLDVLEKTEDTSDKVHLMTLHAAKGLEFNNVYLIGMEEEILPHYASIEADDIEEERRLAYVGITRARARLTFTHVKTRRRGGETVVCQPSRFLEELPQEHLQWLGSVPKTTLNIGNSFLRDIKELLKP